MYDAVVGDGSGDINKHMTEAVKEAEIVDLVPAKVDDMLALVKETDKPIYQAMSALDSLDWSKLKPNQTALLLMQKPMPVSGGGTMYLTFRQALLFAVRAFELGLSPFSDNVWFDPARSSVNLTMSGKRELARLRKIDMGPPVFEEVTQEWSDVPKITEQGEEARKLGFTKNMGCRCSIRVGDPKNGESVNYLATINDWFVPKSPVWRAKPGHMLTIRANEKALTLILGTGASSFPDERELEGA